MTSGEKWQNEENCKLNIGFLKKWLQVFFVSTSKWPELVDTIFSSTLGHIIWHVRQQRIYLHRIRGWKQFRPGEACTNKCMGDKHSCGCVSGFLIKPLVCSNIGNIMTSPVDYVSKSHIRPKISLNENPWKQIKSTPNKLDDWIPSIIHVVSSPVSKKTLINCQKKKTAIG